MMEKFFNLNKGGLIIAQVGLTFLNYLLWAVVLKPMGIAESIGSANNAIGGSVTASDAAAMGWGYAIAKTFVYLATTGVFIALLAKNKAYQKLSMGTPVLACTGIALAFDFLNMTLLPSFIFYGLTTLLLFASKEVDAAAPAQTTAKAS